MLKKKAKQREDMKFISLLFGFLLVVTTEVSISNASKDVAKMEDRSHVLLCGTSVDEECLDNVVAHGISKIKVKGRKMLDEEVLEKEMEKGGDKNDISILTGKDEYYSKMPCAPSQIEMDNKLIQKKRKLPNPTNQIPADSLGLASIRSPKAKAHPGTNSQTIGSKRFLKAAMDTFNMLNVDYKHTRPRRKPPINNGKPPSNTDVKF